MKMIIEIETQRKSDVIHAYATISSLIHMLDLTPKSENKKELEVAKPFPGGGDKVKKS